MPYSSLPEPMLAKSGPLPQRRDFAYEVKCDGFRAIASTEGPLSRDLRLTPRRGRSYAER